MQKEPGRGLLCRVCLQDPAQLPLDGAVSAEEGEYVEAGKNLQGELALLLQHSGDQDEETRDFQTHPHQVG